MKKLSRFHLTIKGNRRKLYLVYKGIKQKNGFLTPGVYADEKTCCLYGFHIMLNQRFSCIWFFKPF